MWANLFFFCITETYFLYRPAESSKEAGQKWQVAHLGGGQYSIIGYTTGLSISLKNGSLVLDIFSIWIKANDEGVQALKNKQRQRLYHQVIALHGGPSMLVTHLIPKTTSTFFTHRSYNTDQLSKYSILFFAPNYHFPFLKTPTKTKCIFFENL